MGVLHYPIGRVATLVATCASLVALLGHGATAAGTAAHEAGDAQLVRAYDSNLAFTSPYTNVPNMGIPKPSPKKHRELAKRGVAGVKFLQGVASGDPMADRVILWTRLTVDSDAPVTVHWEVATTPTFDKGTGAASGDTVTTKNVDYTVKVDAAGLKPSSEYWYRFSANGAASPVGRTKTIPQQGSPVDKLRIATVTCSNMPHGYFHAYDRLADRDGNDIDFVMHLGDTIYEYNSTGYPSKGATMPPERQPLPDKDLVTLQDYRTRHAQYRTERESVRLFSKFPFVIIWDDHDFADNSWKHGSVDHKKAVHGDWLKRKLAAARAFFEWMPIRPATASGTLLRVYRTFQFGDLVDFILLDTRIEGRDEQAVGKDAERCLISDRQEQWLFDNLKASRATWRALGNQIIMAEMPRRSDIAYDIPELDDIWVAYPRSRRNLLNFVKDNQIGNIIVMTGDAHSSMAADIYTSQSAYNKDTGEGSLMVEFVTPSVTSDSPAQGNPVLMNLLSKFITQKYPGAKYVDMKYHGYVVLEFTRERATAEFWYVRDVKRPAGAGAAGQPDASVQTLGHSVVVPAGKNRIASSTGTPVFPGAAQEEADNATLEGGAAMLRDPRNLSLDQLRAQISLHDVMSISSPR